MIIPQLSVFLENRPGQLLAPCRLLADAGFDLLALALADTTQFGILRLIVRDGPRARRVLEAAGYTVTVTNVLALEVRNRPGGLATVLEVFGAAGINIEYMYAFAVQRQEQALLVFRVEQPERAEAALREAGLSSVEAAGLEGLASG